MINLREIIPTEVLEIIKNEFKIGDRLDTVIEHMNREIHENNTTIFKRLKKLAVMQNINLEGKTIKKAIESLKEFNENDIIEMDNYSKGYYVNGYEPETDYEYASHIYPLFKSFADQIKEDRNNLIEEKKHIEERLKEIDKILKND